MLIQSRVVRVLLTTVYDTLRVSVPVILAETSTAAPAGSHF